MAVQVSWRQAARDDYDDIVRLIAQVWYDQIIFDFEDLVEHALARLSEQPEIGSYTESFRGIRRLVLHKNVVLYYAHFPDKNLIEIVRLFDPRQNPDKLIL